MQVVATLSLKGGVGKTTVALGLAGAAQQHGLRALVVDLDPQANATIALDTGPTTATVADVLDEPRRSVLERAITPSGWGAGLDVLVGDEQTERHNHPDPSGKQLIGLTGRLQRLQRPVRGGAHPSGDPEDRSDDPDDGRRAVPAGDRGLPALARAAHRSALAAATGPCS